MVLNVQYLIYKIFYNVIHSFFQSRFSLVVALPDQDWDVSGSSPGHSNGFKNASQTVMVIMSLSKEKTLAIKKFISYLMQLTSSKGCIIKRADCLIRLTAFLPFAITDRRGIEPNMGLNPF